MSFVNTKQDSDSLDVMLHTHASTLPSSPSKQDTRSHTQTDNYRGTKKPSKFTEEEKDSLDTQSSRQQRPLKQKYSKRKQSIRASAVYDR